MSVRAWGAIFLFLGIVWIGIVLAGFIRLYNYDFKSGPTLHLAEQWPAQTSIERRPDMWQLVMVAHPHCPCTKASIEELEKIMALGQGKINACVLFIKPREFNEDWVKSDNYKNSLKISGVTTIIDVDAHDINLLGGTTSGQTFFYNPQGHLVFSGGITASRGHSGDNVGVDTIIALINNQPVQTVRTPFFGCLLQEGQKPNSGD